jgi:hypothetical protein
VLFEIHAFVENAGDFHGVVAQAVNKSPRSIVWERWRSALMRGAVLDEFESFQCSVFGEEEEFRLRVAIRDQLSIED